MAYADKVRLITANEKKQRAYTMDIKNTRIILIILVILFFFANAPKLAFPATSAEQEEYREANSAYLELSHDPTLRKNKTNWMKVVKKFDDVAEKYPDSSLAPKALYMEGKLYEQIYGYFFKKSDLEEALNVYRNAAGKYPDSETAPDALFKEAKVYEVRLKNKDKAITLYREILTKYPGRDASRQAKEALHALNATEEKNGEKEIIKSPGRDDHGENDLAEITHIDKVLVQNNDKGSTSKDDASQQIPGDQPSLVKQLSLKVTKIVIDPGHGGKDPGAIGPHGEREKDITLAVGKKLAKRLKEEGFEVFLTREDDTFIPLEERTAFANRKKADLFISIHVNAHNNTSMDGVETYFLNMTRDASSIKVAERENASTSKALSSLQFIIKDLMLSSKINESSRLATYVQNSIMSSHQKSGNSCRDHGVKQALFCVLVGAQMPAILIETGFITNPVECIYLQKDEYQNKIVDGIVNGINAYATNGKNSGLKVVGGNSSFRKKGKTAE
jgi:N-acetylmuramoyl-L-alanine amidase